MSGGSTNSEVSLERVLALLDRWRHLPAYQLERPAATFFALFLPEVLKEVFKLEEEPEIVPEFPIKKPTNHQSHNVDFLAYARGCRHSFLVELKTDMASVDEAQKERLKRTARSGLEKLVCDVKDLAVNSPYKQKYVHLLWHLQKLGLLSGVDDVFDKTFPSVKPGIVRRIESVRITRSLRTAPKVRLVYVQPKCCACSDIRFISFREFAGLIQRGETKTDAIRRSFGRYLERWKVKAGEFDLREVQA